MNSSLRAEVAAWIARDPDPDDRATLQALLADDNESELERRFASPLSFGTAGLRGPLEAGPAGMNRYTVRRATQGVIAWLDEIGVDPAKGVVVGRDARNGSEVFNHEVVAVLLGAHVKVYELSRPLPTPFVAYGVKALGAAAGIMITASHNPPEDNGFKLYSSDGAQIVPPNDEIVERHANNSSEPTLAARTSRYHRYVSEDLVSQYRQHFATRFAVEGGSDLRIVYTALHGVGGATMIQLFAQAGYRRVTPVAAQFEPDPRFPTLAFPNPEEPGALDLAIATADDVGARLVIANDPDADRLGAAVRGPLGWHVLRGDEIGWLLAAALLPQMTSANDVVATTIVSSTLLGEMARRASVNFAMTLTGFKWISRAAGAGVLRFGYEEALGFAVDPAVADKDGMSAALALAHLADRLDREGRTLLDQLDEIESRFGVHCVSQLSVRVSGTNGLELIRASVAKMRATPPTSLGAVAVSAIHDLALGYQGLLASDGLLFELGSTGRVVVRPSGTETKLKAYIEVTSAPCDVTELAAQRGAAWAVVDAIRLDLETRLAL